jgi:hypothetical protein
MRKLIGMVLVVCALGMAASAQEVVKKEDKTRRTATAGQRVHNMFHRHKHYSGYKTKHIVKVKEEKH